MRLYGHPFSSYCQKALIALYENDTPFDYRSLAEAGAAAEMTALWPLAKFPVLHDGTRTIVEASVIVEYLGLAHPGPVRLVPADPTDAIETRMLDRLFDNYVMTPMQTIVADSARSAEAKHPAGVATAHLTLDAIYRWLDAHLIDREWAAGAFGLADCAAAPALFYADWVHPIADEFANLRAYRARLNARPSFARAIAEARPYRGLFPPGAPDRD